MSTRERRELLARFVVDDLVRSLCFEFTTAMRKLLPTAALARSAPATFGWQLAWAAAYSELCARTCSRNRG
jgi:hypothetical protein